jgi:hypothetical protein
MQALGCALSAMVYPRERAVHKTPQMTSVDPRR